MLMNITYSAVRLDKMTLKAMRKQFVAYQRMYVELVKSPWQSHESNRAAALRACIVLRDEIERRREAVWLTTGRQELMPDTHEGQPKVTGQPRAMKRLLDERRYMSIELFKMTRAFPGHDKLTFNCIEDQA